MTAANVPPIDTTSGAQNQASANLYGVDDENGFLPPIRKSLPFVSLVSQPKDYLSLTPSIFHY